MHVVLRGTVYRIIKRSTMPLGREGWLVEGATFKQIVELNKDNEDG